VVKLHPFLSEEHENMHLLKILRYSVFLSINVTEALSTDALTFSMAFYQDFQITLQVPVLCSWHEIIIFFFS